jgi:hypothetical protein
MDIGATLRVVIGARTIQAASLTRAPDQAAMGAEGNAPVNLDPPTWTHMLDFEPNASRFFAFRRLG